MGGVVDRIMSLFSMGTVARVDDSNALQLIDVDGPGDEDFQEVERLQPYGITANVPDGSEVICIHINGLREHPIAIVIDSSEHRITGLKKGEVCVYSQHGNTILLNEDGEIILNGGEESAVKGDTFKSTYDAHVHPTAFGPSGVPSVLYPATGLNETVKL